MSSKNAETVYICFNIDREIIDVVKASSREKAEEHVIKLIADLAGISYEEAKEDFEEWYDLRAYEVSVVDGEESG